MRAENRRIILEKMPQNAICAEIGVWDGGFSEVIIEVTSPKVLHLIDPWLFQPEYKNSAFGRKPHEYLMDDKFASVSKLFKDNKHVKIHKAFSSDALETFEDDYLDWVYIDGNHNYDIVSKDLEICRQKVKPNGIISGDDYYWRNKKPDPPVKRAVQEFLTKLGDSASFELIGQQYFIQLKNNN